MNDFVASRHKSPFIGVVLDRKKRNGVGDLLSILVVKDRRGNIPRKRIMKVLDEAWTKEVLPFDISHINKDWFANMPNLERYK